MKKNNFKKISIVLLLALFVLSASSTVVAAPTTPSLGIANTFSILANTFTRNIGVTVITGDLGYTTLSGGSTHTVSGVTHIANSTYNQAGIDQLAALGVLNAQLPCTHTFLGGAVNLATDTTHGTIGVYKPGIYCNTPTSASSIGTAGITLDGTGTYIFRMDGALTTESNSNVRLINGASSCDVFWTPSEATTLGANSTFKGTVIDAAGITVGNNTTWNGRALAFGGTVTTDTDAISSACSVGVTSSASSSTSTGGSIIYGCKDPKATNYNYFSSSNPALCKYTNISSTPILTLTPSVIVPTFPKTGFPLEVNNASWFNNLLSFIENLFK